MAILECVYEVGGNGLALQAASDEAETVDPAKAISALAQSRLGAPTGGGAECPTPKSIGPTKPNACGTQREPSTMGYGASSKPSHSDGGSLLSERPA